MQTQTTEANGTAEPEIQSSQRVILQEHLLFTLGDHVPKQEPKQRMLGPPETSQTSPTVTYTTCKTDLESRQHSDCIPKDF